MRKSSLQTFFDPTERVVFSSMLVNSRHYLGNLTQTIPQTYFAKALSEGLAGKPITQLHTDNQGCVISW